MAEKKKLSLEESLERLEEIVKELENEKLTLDKALKLYEEGIALVRTCNKQLDNAEKKIRILTQTPDGEIEEKDFANDEE